MMARVALMLLALLHAISQSERKPGAAASPVHKPKWEECKQQSRRLYQHARNVYHATKTSQRITPTVDIPRIHCDDGCDPWSLRREKKRCLHPVLRVLHWYIAVFTSVKVDTSIEAEVIAVKNGMENLKGHLEAATGLHIAPVPPPTVDEWEREVFMKEVAENLLTFSSLVARIFHPGNPAHHAVQ
ncbi:interleukin-23 subunit alpha [Ambystoma mexicanum]|uniref:interleukin-23 subunit alpha n=1 Tax=Ambystoma mexicanum TaxID=8296 RepID=UPI0037E8E799